MCTYSSIKCTMYMAHTTNTNDRFRLNNPNWNVFGNLPVVDSLAAAVLSVVLSDGLSATQYSSLSGLIARQLPSSVNWISVQFTSLFKMSTNKLDSTSTKPHLQQNHHLHNKAHCRLGFSFSVPEFPGMERPHSRRKREWCSWWHCCHLAS